LLPLRFLLQCRQCTGEAGLSHSLTTQQLVDMAIQVNAGLHYLHRKQIVHKDIAARNCV
jgi:RYK receptor-like tyrosine kinase